jgi:plasmid stabilization system protein ParE
VARDYVLAKGAAEDLRNIIRYTNERWGEAQCLAYVRQLEDAAASVARGQGFFKDFSVLHPGLRMARCGRHYIFCLPRSDALPIILAILHERMDIMARLKSRLE